VPPNDVSCSLWDNVVDFGALFFSLFVRAWQGRDSGFARSEAQKTATESRCRDEWNRLGWKHFGR
jgi:hypothetical protein